MLFNFVIRKSLADFCSITDNRDPKKHSSSRKPYGKASVEFNTAHFQSEVLIISMSMYEAIRTHYRKMSFKTTGFMFRVYRGLGLTLGSPEMGNISESFTTLS